MCLLDLSKVLKCITDGQIKYTLYDYYDKNISNLIDHNHTQFIDISREILFSIIVKITLPRDFKNIKNIEINNDNKKQELEHQLEDSDSLFLININCRDNDYILYNGNKIYNGSCIISKNEIVQIFQNKNINISIMKKMYYSIIADTEQYIDIIESAFNMVNTESVNDNSVDINHLISIFVQNTIMDGRLYVADLILRDYYNLLKQEIDKLENEGYKIYRVDNTKIFYI